MHGAWSRIPSSPPYDVWMAIVYLMWSSNITGDEDKPGSYPTVSFEVLPDGTVTRLIIMQNTILNEDAGAHAEQKWNFIIDSMRKAYDRT